MRIRPVHNLPLRQSSLRSTASRDLVSLLLARLTAGCGCALLPATPETPAMDALRLAGNRMRSG